MSNWNELYDYVMQHKDQVHVFGSKQMGWIRISWPGSSKMLFKVTATMKDAEHYLKHAITFTEITRDRVIIKNEKAAAETTAQ
jgi:hypothetical protein